MKSLLRVIEIWASIETIGSLVFFALSLALGMFADSDPSRDTAATSAAYYFITSGLWAAFWIVCSLGCWITEDRQDQTNL